MLELMDPPSYFFTWFTLTAVVVVMKIITKYGAKLGLTSATTEILCVPFQYIFCKLYNQFINITPKF